MILFQQQKKIQFLSKHENTEQFSGSWWNPFWNLVIGSLRYQTSLCACLVIACGTSSKLFTQIFRDLHQNWRSPMSWSEDSRMVFNAWKMKLFFICSMNMWKSCNKWKMMRTHNSLLNWGSFAFSFSIALSTWFYSSDPNAHRGGWGKGPVDAKTQLFNLGVSKNSGTPKSSILNRVFHYKPSILGYHYFRKHPSVSVWIFSFSASQLLVVSETFRSCS